MTESRGRLQSRQRSRNPTIGLILSAILGALDFPSVLGGGSDDAPPAFILVSSAVFGIVTLVGVWLAWSAKPHGNLEQIRVAPAGPVELVHRCRHCGTPRVECE